MYDTVTRQLILGAPALKGLDLERLPADLTKVYAELVSLRLAVREAGAGAGETPPADLDRVRRLANTYETYAALFAEGSSRDAAAFVAATAHGILALAAEIGGGTRATRVAATHVSSDLSACLLFLSAGYFADAAEVARSFKPADDLGDVPLAVVTVVAELATGEVARARSHAETALARDHKLVDSESDAVTMLWRGILGGLAALTSAIRGDGSEDEAHRAFEGVIHASAARFVIPGGKTPVIGTFAGPHHLATLLARASPTLAASSTARLGPPAGVGGGPWNDSTAAIARRRPFLWRNHQAAITSGFLSPGTSAVLSFPTGAGKSTLAELKVASALANGRSTLYLVPTHALVSQVARDLGGAFPRAKIQDLLVRDAAYSEVDDADSAGAIAVMTPERGLTIMSASPGDLKHVGLIVLDECHLLHPSKRPRDHRGLDAMLCLLKATELNPEADVLLISAMMANPEELSAWIKDLTGRNCEALVDTWKPTRQVRGCVMFDGARMKALAAQLAAAKAVNATRAPSAPLKRQLTARPHGLFGLLQTWATTETRDYVLVPLSDREVQLGASAGWRLTANRNDAAARLAVWFAERRMRALVFAKDPKNARAVANAVAGLLPADRAFAPDEQHLFDVACAEAGGNQHVLGVTGGGAVYHHGLLLPAERRLVESLYRKESETPCVMVGTPTLAQGINLPTDVVIVAGDDRYDPATSRNAPLEAQELLNAVGRAGRAGYASVGIVLVIPGDLVTFEAKNLSKRWFQLREDVFSKMDQCLKIDDPVETILDVVQSSVEPSTDASYFLSRLPDNAESVATSLSRSFGAYRAKVRGSDAAYQAKIHQVAALRDRRSRPGDERALKLSLSSGIDGDTAQSIVDEIASNVEGWRTYGIAEIVGRTFAWLGAKPGRVDAYLRTARGSDDEDAVEGSGVAIAAVSVGVARWVAGGTLKDVEETLLGKPLSPKSTGCLRARKLVLRTVPDVAYVVGLFAHAFRLLVGDDGSMPIALAVAAECVKRGLDSPELLALAHLRRDEASRAELRSELAGAAIAPPMPGETFADVIARISAIVNNPTT